MEKRQHSRIPFVVQAELTSEKKLLYTGHSKDFSFGGMYFLCDHAVFLPSQQICDLKIFTGEGNGSRAVELKCHCIRTDKDGFAVRFVSIQRSHYELLKEMISGRATDSDELFEEHNSAPVFEIDG